MRHAFQDRLKFIFHTSLTAFLSVSGTKWLCRFVICVVLCPNSSPVIYKLVPFITILLAKTCLRSCILKSFSPALRQAVIKDFLKLPNLVPLLLNTYKQSSIFSIAFKSSFSGLLIGTYLSYLVLVPFMAITSFCKSTYSFAEKYTFQSIQKNICPI